MTTRFERNMRLMRSKDPQEREDGFHFLLPHAADHIDELIAAFRQEQDGGLRCWLLELIGDARSPTALDVLAEQLYGDDDSLRAWAVRGWRKLDTKPAGYELWKARANGLID